MEYWLIVVIFLWTVSSYLYHTSTFTGDIESDKERLQELIDELNGIKKTPKPKELKPVFFRPKDRTANIIDLKLTKTYMFISAKAKQAYLDSPEWRALKTKRLVIAQNKCECCGSIYLLQCHHTTYERLTCEHIEDVRILCGGSDGCHQKIHDILGYDRTTNYPISIIEE